MVEASQVTFTHNKPIARVGDKVTCPIPGHGTTVIVEGDPTMILDGKPVARHGDKCACGAVLISSQVVSSIGSGGDGGNSGSAVSRDSPQHGAQVSSKEQTSSTTESVGLQFDDKFKLWDEETGEPLANAPYAIKRASGSLEHGTTDDQGHTHILSSTLESESIEIYA